MFEYSYLRIIGFLLARLCGDEFWRSPCDIPRNLHAKVRPAIKRVDPGGFERPVVVTMRLLTFLPALGLVGQALAISHPCYSQQPRVGEIPSDKVVKEYFAKLAPATKLTLLHDTTGPEAGAHVSFTPPPLFVFVFLVVLCCI